MTRSPLHQPYPNVTEALIKDLKERIKIPETTPDTTLPQVYYRAGILYVLDLLERSVPSNGKNYVPTKREASTSRSGSPTDAAFD
jgi:hypothetical protein